jgi:translation initiation factor IF-3
VVETHEARRMAEEAGLDLVEIQPDVRPPLCKIMDYGKYRYELSKKQKGQKAKTHELKEVRLGRSAKIDPHDVEIRVKQARRFLLEGHKVQLVQQFRGREMAHKDIGLRRLQEICKTLEDVAKVESPPKHVGRRVTLLLAPDRVKIEAIKRKADAQKAKAESAPAAAEEATEQGDAPAQAAPPAEAPSTTPAPAAEASAPAVETEQAPQVPADIERAAG